MQPPNLTLSLRGPPGSRRTLRAAAAEDNKLVVAAEETLVVVTLEEDDEEEDALQEEEEDDDKEDGLVDSAALRLRFFGVGISESGWLALSTSHQLFWALKKRMRFLDKSREILIS